MKRDRKFRSVPSAWRTEAPTTADKKREIRERISLFIVETIRNVFTFFPTI